MLTMIATCPQEKPDSSGTHTHIELESAPDTAWWWEWWRSYSKAVTIIPLPSELVDSVEYVNQLAIGGVRLDLKDL